MSGYAGGVGQPANPPPVTIITTGSTFSPSVQVASANVTVNWQWAGGSTTGLQPTISFGSSGTRAVYMTATNPGGYNALNLVQTFNLGFSHLDDIGRNSLPSAYDWPVQSVSGVSNIRSMTGLKYFLAADNVTLTGPLNLSGMSQLLNIECYASSFSSVNLTGCNSLIRFVMEECQLTTVDLTPVVSTLQEFRAALQQGGTLTIVPVSAMPNLYHWCVHDQTFVNMPNFSTGFPQLTQLWCWNTGQSGTLTLNSTVAMDSILAHNNAYTTLNVANQFPFVAGQLTGQIAMASNSLTSVNITGDNLLYSVDFSNNQLPQSQVDSVLTTMNGFGTTDSLGLVDVSGTGNASPSSTGTTAKGQLQGRSWTVNTN